MLQDDFSAKRLMTVNTPALKLKMKNENENLHPSQPLHLFAYLALFALLTPFKPFEHFEHNVNEKYNKFK